MNELITSCFESFLRHAKEDVKTQVEPKTPPRELQPPAKKQKIKAEVKSEPVMIEEDADEIFARELQAQLSQPRASRSAGAESSPRKKRKAVVQRKRKTETIVNSDGETVEVEVKRAPTNNAFNKLLTLSDELAAILGTPYLSRPQVAKQIWAYIKAPGRNLQDPNDKRYINCDETLTALLGTPRVHMFTMTKLLQKHMKVSLQCIRPNGEFGLTKQDDGTAPLGFGADGGAALLDSKKCSDDEADAKITIKKQEDPSSEESD